MRQVLNSVTIAFPPTLWQVLNSVAIVFVFELDGLMCNWLLSRRHFAAFERLAIPRKTDWIVWPVKTDGEKDLMSGLLWLVYWVDIYLMMSIYLLVRGRVMGQCVVVRVRGGVREMGWYEVVCGGVV